MLAYACSPYHGSEPGTGWQRAVESSKHFDTWVICEQGEFEPDIRRFEREHGPLPGLHFRFVAKTRFESLLGRIPGLYYVGYNLWHRRAYRAALELHRRVGFDLTHQANMCGFREPGYLWKLPPPFVWGPVGGTQDYPWRFLRGAGWPGAARELTRSIVNRAQLRFSRSVRAAAKRAAVIMAANSQNQRDFARVHGVTPELFLEIGVRSVKDRGPRGNASGTLKLLWSGEFKAHKALHLLIAALKKVPASIPYELRILGDGPLENRWKRLARIQGIESHCRWLGWLSLPEAMAQYDWADLLVFTSLRDTAGTVVLEALSRGVPVVCLDHQGAGDIVTPACGVKIPVARPGQVVDDLSDALISLAQHPERLDTLSRGASMRAEEYLWSRHGQRLAGIYRRVLEDNVYAGNAAQEGGGMAEPSSADLPGAGERLQ
ncbi:MAG TPA: glycosyltransferase [Thermoanaerobaculales bacterium]|nr:glycosyltransferase [Thermoanaerobaculales bacterium]